MRTNFQNNFLKSKETVSIIPAPVETRSNAGIAWYDVQMFNAERRVKLLACDTDGNVKETFEFQMQSDTEGRLTFDAGASVLLEAGLNLTKQGISRSENLLQGVRRSGAKLSSHWASLLDPLSVLAIALKSRAADANSWGCGPCIILGAGVALGAGLCAEGNPAACVGALSGGATFLENCGGACA